MSETQFSSPRKSSGILRYSSLLTVGVLNHHVAGSSRGHLQKRAGCRLVSPLSRPSRKLTSAGSVSRIWPSVSFFTAFWPSCHSLKKELIFSEESFATCFFSLSFEGLSSMGQDFCRKSQLSSASKPQSSSAGEAGSCSWSPWAGPPGWSSSTSTSRSMTGGGADFLAAGFCFFLLGLSACFFLRFSACFSLSPAKQMFYFSFSLLRVLFLTIAK